MLKRATFVVLIIFSFLILGLSGIYGVIDRQMLLVNEGGQEKQSAAIVDTARSGEDSLDTSDWGTYFNNVKSLSLSYPKRFSVVDSPEELILWNERRKLAMASAIFLDEFDEKDMNYFERRTSEEGGKLLSWVEGQNKENCTQGFVFIRPEETKEVNALFRNCREKEIKKTLWFDFDLDNSGVHGMTIGEIIQISKSIRVGK